jgi:hypothetical protein
MVAGRHLASNTVDSAVGDGAGQHELPHKTRRYCIGTPAFGPGSWRLRLRPRCASGTTGMALRQAQDRLVPERPGASMARDGKGTRKPRPATPLLGARRMQTLRALWPRTAAPDQSTRPSPSGHRPPALAMDGLNPCASPPRRPLLKPPAGPFASMPPLPLPLPGTILPDQPNSRIYRGN